MARALQIRDKNWIQNSKFSAQFKLAKYYSLNSFMLTSSTRNSMLICAVTVHHEVAWVLRRIPTLQPSPAQAWLLLEWRIPSLCSQARRPAGKESGCHTGGSNWTDHHKDVGLLLESERKASGMLVTHWHFTILPCPLVTVNAQVKKKPTIARQESAAPITHATSRNARHGGRGSRMRGREMMAEGQNPRTNCSSRWQARI